MESSVQDVAGNNRYEITADGEPAGFVEYHRHRGVIAFLHTEVGDEFGGQGVASALIEYALDDAREQGLRVEPFCPFVRGYLAKHPEYLDLVGDRARFEL